MLKFMFLGINGSIQEPGGGNTSLLFWGDEGCAAVDLSCNLASAVQADIDAVIFTHEHIDHVYGLPSLLHQLWLCGRARPLHIYAPDGMRLFLEGFIGLFKLREKKGMFPICISSQANFSVGSMRFSLFPADHTDVSVGIVVEEGGDKLVYTADTRPIKAPIPCMAGARILIHEASGTSGNEEVLIKKGHSSGADAGRLAASLKAERLYLCHLPETGKEDVLRDAAAVFPEARIPRPLELLS